MNPNFWKNKKVLLTGHTGFKGSWLSIWLEKIGANVTGFSDRIPTRPSLFEILNLEDKINSITGDIRDYNQIEKVIEQNKPEIIIHLAAQSLVTFIKTFVLENFLVASKTLIVPMTFVE